MSKANQSSSEIQVSVSRNIIHITEYYIFGQQVMSHASNVGCVTKYAAAYGSNDNLKLVQISNVYRHITLCIL